jgi:hypothetical protein
MKAYTIVKMSLDPNNIACRRWEYDTGCGKKFIVLF